MKQLRRNQKKFFSAGMLIRQSFEDSTVSRVTFLKAWLSYPIIKQEWTTLRVKNTLFIYLHAMVFILMT